MPKRKFAPYACRGLETPCSRSDHLRGTSGRVGRNHAGPELPLWTIIEQARKSWLANHGGRLRAGGRGERDRGGVWGGWAVARGGGVSGCRDAAGGSISRRGCSAQALGAVGEGLVAPGQNSPLMRLQLGDLAFPVDGGVGAVLLAGQDEVPSTPSPHFPCQAPTRRQRGVKRWVWRAKRASARGAHLRPFDRTAGGGSDLSRAGAGVAVEVDHALTRVGHPAQAKSCAETVGEVNT